MRAFILLLLALCACSSGSTDTPSVTPPAQEPEPTPSEAPPSEDACSAQLIRRAGLDTRTPECVDGVERFGSLPSADFACTTDADCSIYMAAGGCLGVNVASAAHSRMEPLYAACIIDDTECGDADFSDHRTECREGCCVVYEE